MRRSMLLLLAGCSGGLSAFEPNALTIVASSSDAGASVAPPYGIVTVRDTHTASGHLNDVRATFGVTDGCERVQAGACSLVRCDGDAGVASNGHDVGSLRFSGFSLVGVSDPITLIHPYGAASARPRLLYDGGEPVGVVSTGFALTAPAPSPLRLTPPSCTPLECLGTVSRSRPLAVDWTPAPFGRPVVQLTLERWVMEPPATTFTLKRDARLECEYPEGEVRARIPVETLALLPLVRDAGFASNLLVVLRRSSAGAQTDAGVVRLDVESAGHSLPFELEP